MAISCAELDNVYGVMMRLTRDTKGPPIVCAGDLDEEFGSESWVQLVDGWEPQGF